MNNPTSLIPILSDKYLLVEPIWEKPIDEIEGPLYQEYIKKNPGYNKLYVRPEVAKKLQKAAQSLPARYLLVIRAGHRPIEVQHKLLDMVKNSYKKTNPDASASEVLEFARTYVSDPEIKTPPHCCGAAVDVDMIDRQTRFLVDFGCPVNTDSDISHLNTDKLTKEQKTNRDMLHKAMLGAGFAPFTTEWWHFSYGDDVWADFYNKPEAIYGLVEPEV